MSESLQAEELRTLIQELRQEVLANWEDSVSRDRQISDLQFRVSSLQEEIEHVHRQVEQLRSRNNDWEETDEGDFELVAEANAHSDFTPPLRGAAARGRAARGQIVLGRPGVGSSAQGTAEEVSAIPEVGNSEREDIAREIGLFFKRCLQEGVPRGLSGRERLPLRSRYYVVIRDYEGRILRFARFFHSWGPAKAIVFRFGGSGQSVYCGFATIWEARIAVETAGYAWAGREYWGYNGR